MYIVSIPEITTEELLARYKRIKPIVDYYGKYYLRNFTEQELREVSYIWDKQHYISNCEVDMRLYVSNESLEFECIHKYKYPELFTPNIADVLAQIPDRWIKFVDAFEIIEFPDGSTDFAKNKILLENGYHMSKVKLYVKKFKLKDYFREDIASKREV